MTKHVGSVLIGALTFLLLYLAVSPITGAVSAGELPLPGAPAATVHHYFSANVAATVLTGLLQGLSGLGLALVVAGIAAGREARPYGRLATFANVAGWTATGAILVSAALSVVLGLIASDAGDSVVVSIRNLSFSTGGVIHVVALGAFALAAIAAAAASRPVRVVGWVAGTLAVLSLLSVIIYYASVFLPVGRLACMIALVVAGASRVIGRARQPAI